jgi:hypothetical protein
MKVSPNTRRGMFLFVIFPAGVLERNRFKITCNISNKILGFERKPKSV